MEEASRGTPVIMIEAGAGTGKTTTDRMLVDVLQGRGQYTAFNKSLVVDSSGKFRGTACQCNTTHSLAFRAIGSKYSHRLGGNRVRAKAIAEMIGIKNFSLPSIKDSEGKEVKEKELAAQFLATRVMMAIGNFCQSADREIGGKHFAYMDGLDQPADGKRTYDNNDAVKEYLVPFAQKAWADIADPDGTMPFTHDHYVKLWQLNDPVISADYILLDEAQDTAPVMLDILAQQVNPDREYRPQVILVGDSAQQIYEWRGAVNALAAFPGAPRLYLSQSFRFGPAIAEVANAVLSLLQEQTQLRLRGYEAINSTVVSGATSEQPDAILCRTNAMAVGYLLEAIDHGKHPYLVGGSSQLISFVQGAKDLQETGNTSHPELACFSSWGELQQYVSMDEGKDLQLMVKLIDSFGVTTILDALRGMPQEEDADLVISTAHKSKGREWRHVKLASDFPVKSKCGDAELKLLYVALTRAKETLDVSECPFFTGNDSMNVDRIISSGKYAAPEAPAQPQRSASDKFTWRKWEGRWCVQGPYDREGEVVDVYRRDGSCQRKTLGKPLAEFQDATVYSID
jgi:superfamily I DNA/RNA helicase